VLRRIVVPLLVVHFTLAAISGYRAIVQVYRVDIDAQSLELQAESPTTVRATTSGRTTVDVGLELVQGNRARTLTVLHIPGHRDGAMDFRPIRASRTVTVPDSVLRRFEAGPALLRATAHGRSQWLRVPPPVIKELSVTLRGSDVR
jgi:hypothetical protein